MKNILYLGLEAPLSEKDSTIIHCPIIEIVPRDPTLPDIVTCFSFLEAFTHIIFTSKSSVKIFMSYLTVFGLEKRVLEDKVFICVGKQTTNCLKTYGVLSSITAQLETAEGVVEELKKINLNHSFLFWPHSSSSRSTIITYFKDSHLSYNECSLYDTIPCKNPPSIDLNQIDEIVFTSSSCVEAFLFHFKSLPLNKILTPIGPVTKDKLHHIIARS